MLLGGYCSKFIPMICDVGCQSAIRPRFSKRPLLLGVTSSFKPAHATIQSSQSLSTRSLGIALQAVLLMALALRLELQHRDMKRSAAMMYGMMSMINLFLKV